jgi:hypothetical protein
MYSTVNGTLDAKGVVGKLQAKGIDKETIFVAWHEGPYGFRVLIKQSSFVRFARSRSLVCGHGPGIIAN